MNRIFLTLALVFACFLLAPPAATQQQHVAYAPYGPATVSVGEDTIHLIASPDDLGGILRSTGAPAADTGVVFEVEWKHDPDLEPSGVNGPLQPSIAPRRSEEARGRDEPRMGGTVPRRRGRDAGRFPAERRSRSPLIPTEARGFPGRGPHLFQRDRGEVLSSECTTRTPVPTCG